MNKLASGCVVAAFALLPHSALSDGKSPAERALEAAYFGDQVVLREVLGAETNFNAYAKAGTDPEHLLKNALVGRQYATIALLAEYGLPRGHNALSQLFSSPLMTPEAAKVFIASVTNFVSSQGPGALAGAVRADNLDLCRVLLEAGVKPEKGILAATFIHRDLRLIELLVKNGADPYLPEGRVSPVQRAILMQSADLLRVLDTEGKYGDSLRAIEKDHSPAKDSKLPGAWRYAPPGGGFGTVAFTFYPDGTAFYAGDAGGGIGVWKEDGPSVEVTPLDEQGKPVAAHVLKARVADDGLILDGAGGRAAASPRVAKRFTPADAESETRYPPFVRVEKVLLTADSNVVLQVSGKHISIPLEQLVKAAQSTPYGMKAVDGNVLKWAEFSPGPIKDQPADAAELPCSDRHASPG